MHIFISITLTTSLAFAIWISKQTSFNCRQLKYTAYIPLYPVFRIICAFHDFVITIKCTILFQWYFLSFSLALCAIWNVTGLAVGWVPLWLGLGLKSMWAWFAVFFFNTTLALRAAKPLKKILVFTCKLKIYDIHTHTYTYIHTFNPTHTHSHTHTQTTERKILHGFNFCAIFCGLLLKY